MARPWVGAEDGVGGVAALSAEGGVVEIAALAAAGVAVVGEELREAGRCHFVLSIFCNILGMCVG